MRAVMQLGPSGLQSWADDIIAVLREAHQAVEEARARGSTAVDPQLLDKLRQCYDEAATFGITYNRLRDDGRLQRRQGRDREPPVWNTNGKQY
jgi:hypothetical protein